MAATKRGQFRIGTCSWSTKDWVGKIYSAGTAQADYIREYAERFDTVEIDATFYGTPRRAVIEGWRDRTPETFMFSAKVPQIVTHEKFMQNCDREINEFLDAMQILGPRLGPIVFQFPYYSAKKNVKQHDFLARLEPFLDTLPKSGFRFVVEVRNKAWLTDRLLTPLREHGVALALIDHPWMSRPKELAHIKGIVTAPFLYVRLLGDRYGIEKITTTWNEHVIDRTNDMAEWFPLVKRELDFGIDVITYVNSHYSGYAPGDATNFRDAIRAT
jgi:uncharacterized protein YecE (DUF72 family)